MKKRTAFYIPFQSNVSERLDRLISKKSFGEEWWRIVQVRGDRKQEGVSRACDRKIGRLKRRAAWDKRMEEGNEPGRIGVQPGNQGIHVDIDPSFEPEFFGSPGFGKSMLAPPLGKDAIVIDDLQAVSEKVFLKVLAKDRLKSDLKKAIRAYQRAQRRFKKAESDYIMGVSDTKQNFQAAIIARGIHAEKVADLTIRLVTWK